jgi:protein involved in polysaccharide export with SLBB domain
MTRQAYPFKRFPGSSAIFLATVLFTVFFTIACSRATYAQSGDTVDDNARVNITVAGEPEVSGDFVVDSAGNITLLYVNQIHIAGLTVPEAQKAVTDKLATVYRNPQVLLKLIGRGGISVTVTGSVANPGERSLRSDAHLNDVLQIASPTVTADLTAIDITHGRPGETHSKGSLNYLSYLNDRNPVGNPPLQDGDVIFVRSKDAVPIQINIRGQVGHPGTLSVPASSTFLDAIQAAGGLNIDADRKNIGLQHTNTTDESSLDFQIAQLNPDDKGSNPTLKDGDTVIVKAVDKPNLYIIVGGVQHPGEFPLPTTPMSLLDAIGKAGGGAPRAKMKDTTITRTSTASGQPEVIHINGDDTALQARTIIMAGDSINIPPGSPAPPATNPLSMIGVLASLVALAHGLKF